MRLTAASAVIVAMMSLGVVATAQVDAGSELDPWSLVGHLMVDQYRGYVESFRGYHCSEIHGAVDEYNDEFFTVDGDPPEGWPNYISPFDMSAEDHAVLIEFFSDDETGVSSFIWPYYEADFCTTVHEDGWLPASEDELNDDNPFVTITIHGPIACDPGELLMIQSGYFFWNGEWQSYYGIDWTEHFGGGIPTVSGTYNMDCMTIVPGDSPDPAEVTELVPSAQDNVNPTVTGLTGLDTWLWYDFSTPTSHTLTATVTVPARGTIWTLDMTAWVDQVLWDVDCEGVCDYHGTLAGFDASGIDYVLDLPDTAEQPADTYDGGSDTADGAAATHVYRVKDDYIVSTSTVWRGLYTFLGITYYYEPVVVSTERSYQVVEVRSIISEP